MFDSAAQVLILGVVFFALALVVYGLLSKRPAKSDTGDEIRKILQAGIDSQKAGSSELAEFEFSKAAALCQETKDCDFSTHASCLIHLAQSQMKRDKFELARESYGRAIALFEAQVAKRNPQALLDIDYHAALTDFGPATEQMVEFYSGVLALRNKHLGPDHTDTVNSRRILSGLLRKIGRSRDAQALEDGQMEVLEIAMEATRSDSESPADGAL